jgi:hypothetical protein
MTRSGVQVASQDSIARDPMSEIMAHDVLQEHVDVLKNKLAAIIVNAELLVQMAEGDASGRAHGLLRSAHSAASVLNSLQGCLR